MMNRRTVGRTCFSMALALSFGLSGPTQGAEPPKAVLEFGKKPVTVVCLGDSVTGVYYHTGGRRAYPEMLELALKRAYPETPVRVVNAGISGHTTVNGLARLDRDVLSHKPDLVTVTFGLNDMGRLTTDEFRENLRTIVTRCQAAGSRVMLCTPNAVIDTAGRPRTKLASYCDTIRTLAKELGLPLCDQYAAGEEHRARDAWDWRLTLSDAIHPNMDGHRHMAEELCLAITGKRVSLEPVNPPEPPLPRTLDRLKRGEPIRVLAMPPFDGTIAERLKAIQPEAKVEVTTWPVAGKSLPDIEKSAAQTVRTMKPDLVLIAVPREATAASDEAWVHSFSWTMNHSLSFGLQEWDCLVIHPSVWQTSGETTRDALVRRLVRAQDLHLLDRPETVKDSGEAVFKGWLERALAVER